MNSKALWAQFSSKGHILNKAYSAFNEADGSQREQGLEYTTCGLRVGDYVAEYWQGAKS